MEITYHPIKLLYTLTAPGEAHTAAIVSSSYPVEEERLPARHIVELYDDLDTPVPGRSFSAQAADRVAAFVKNLPASVTRLYCACDMGQSRSTAITAALRLYNGQDDLPVWEDPHNKPNPLVFSLMCQAWGVAMPDEQLDLRVETNYYAFRKAIRGK